MTDFNQDGKPDLLVGDTVTIENRVEGLTQAKFDRLKAAHKKKMQPLEKKMAAIQAKYMPQLSKVASPEKGQQIIEKMQEEMQPFSIQYSELYQERSKFLKESRTGHVWVYLQQEASSPAPEEEQTVAAESENDQEPDRPL